MAYIHLSLKGFVQRTCVLLLEFNKSFVLRGTAWELVFKIMNAVLVSLSKVYEVLRTGLQSLINMTVNFKVDVKKAHQCLQLNI